MRVCAGFLSLILIIAWPMSAITAPTVRNLGNARSTSSIGTMRKMPAKPTVKSSENLGESAASGVSANTSVARAATGSRLAVGRLHSNAGKTNTGMVTKPDLAGFAHEIDVTTLGRDIQAQINELRAKIDGLRFDQLPLVTGEYLGE